MKHKINEGMIETPLGPVSHVKGEVWKEGGLGLRLHLTLRGSEGVLRQFRRGRLWAILEGRHYTLDCEVSQAFLSAFEGHYSCHGLLLSDDPLYLFTERPRGPIHFEVEGVKIESMPPMDPIIVALMDQYNNDRKKVEQHMLDILLPEITTFGMMVPGHDFIPSPATNAARIGPTPRIPPDSPRTTS